jgi:regulatory protein
VLERLAAHGVDDAAARAAVAAASEAVDFEPLEAARRVLQKRRLLPPSPDASSAGRAPAVLTPKEQARAARLLLGRGFSEEVVSALLGQAALDPPDPSD